MRRRELILGAAGLAAIGQNAFAADDLTAVARDAYLFTLPLIETAAQRAGAPPNVLVHRRTLADFRSRNVTTPNNDTLYSSAQLDLSAGDVTLTLPDSGSRYLSVALMDAYTNNFAIPGTRTTGGKAVTLTIVGPKAPRRGANILRSPTNHVWLLGRTLVDGPADLPAAIAVQSGITLSGPKLAPAPAFARRQAAWADYFAAADKLLLADPPASADAPMMARIAALGLGGGKFDAGKFTPEQAAQIAAGVVEARRPGRAQMPSSAPTAAGASGGVLGDFGTNYALRAQTAISGLAALPAVEAMYMRPPAPAGGFDGGKLAVMHFDAGGLPPVNAFWSLSMYEQTPENQLFFVENPLGRYAIGDRTPGLTKNADGSLDIWLSAADPGPARRANWLPAPKGPYVVTLRAYLPKPEMLSGRWKAPQVVLA